MKDKKVFVSGTSRGIGKSIAEYFLLNNYIVIGTSRSDSNIDKDYKNYHHFSLIIDCICPIPHSLFLGFMTKSPGSRSNCIMEN